MTKKSNMFGKRKRHRRLKTWVKVVLGVLIAIIIGVTAFEVIQYNNTMGNLSASATPKESSSTLTSAVSSKPVSSKVSSSEETSSKTTSSKVASKPSEDEVDAGTFFDDACFMGDSLTVDFVNVPEVGNANIVGGIGVSCYRALNDHKVSINGKKSDVGYMPDRVKAANPKKIYMMFGVNDLTWGDQMSEKKFIGYYSDLIDILKKDCPNAKIYVQSIMPITAAMENQKQTPFDNNKVAAFNSGLKTLSSQKGAKFLDVASIVRGADGKLPKGVSDDGIHLKYAKYKLWLNYLLDNK